MKRLILIVYGASIEHFAKVITSFLLVGNLTLVHPDIDIHQAGDQLAIKPRPRICYSSQSLCLLIISS